MKISEEKMRAEEAARMKELENKKLD